MACNNVRRNVFVKAIISIEHELSKHYLEQKASDKYRSFLINLEVTADCVNLWFFHVGSKGKCRSICLQQTDLNGNIIGIGVLQDLFIGNFGVEITFDSCLNGFNWSSGEVNVVLDCLKSIGIKSV